MKRLNAASAYVTIKKLGLETAVQNIPKDKSFTVGDIFDREVYPSGCPPGTTEILKKYEIIEKIKRRRTTQESAKWRATKKHRELLNVIAKHKENEATRVKE